MSDNVVCVNIYGLNHPQEEDLLRKRWTKECLEGLFQLSAGMMQP